MANFKSIITDRGAAALTALVSPSARLSLTRAVAGDGRATVSPNTLTDLAHQADIRTELAGSEFVDGDTPLVRISVQVTNASLTAPVWVREIGIFARDRNGSELLFCYAYLDGPDSDNQLPATAFDDGQPDTVHLHELSLFVTNQEAAQISVTLGSGSWVTETRLREYAAPVSHTHYANRIYEDSTDTVESAQRRQDASIAALQTQLDTGFAGTTADHRFTAAQISLWKGYEGSGLPEGVWGGANDTRLYL